MNAYILLLLLLVSCGISEDCFKGNGNRIVQSYALEGFTKITVHEGIALIIKEGPAYQVNIETNDKILENLSLIIENDMLIIKDNSTCNLARDYGQTIVYVTTPNLTEIHSKTNQNIITDGVLHYPSIKIFSLDLEDDAGTGDFYLKIENEFLYIESNNISNFYIEGKSKYFDIYFTWGDGKFNGNNYIITEDVNLFHRGTNDIIFSPKYI
ncbi:GIN domain-containing protein, partial [Flavobacterium sp. 9AF]|uniref:GIN domain-containing protein n=1 Tax=Flavobacterium sp. 9AF TaxID=2653142 RepID=UPI0013574575